VISSEKLFEFVGMMLKSFKVYCICPPLFAKTIDFIESIQVRSSEKFFEFFEFVE